jgi:hypothetical protein
MARIYFEIPCFAPTRLIHAEDVAGRDRAGIVYQDIEIFEHVGNGLGRTALREIDGLPFHSPECRELGQGFLQPLLIARDDHDPGAFGKKAAGDRLADALRSASDQNAAVCQSEVHLSSPCLAKLG